MSSNVHQKIGGAQKLIKSNLRWKQRENCVGKLNTLCYFLIIEHATYNSN